MFALLVGEPCLTLSALIVGSIFFFFRLHSRIVVVVIGSLIFASFIIRCGLAPPLLV